MTSATGRLSNAFAIQGELLRNEHAMNVARHFGISLDEAKRILDGEPYVGEGRTLTTKGQRLAAAHFAGLLTAGNE